jgi:hypothetical protein
MAVTFELPSEMEESLRKELDDLDRAAKEALLVDLHRQGKLTHHQLSTALGLTRLEADALLHRHEVFYDLTAEDVIRESEELGKLRGAHADRR